MKSSWWAMLLLTRKRNRATKLPSRGEREDAPGDQPRRSNAGLKPADMLIHGHGANAWERALSRSVRDRTVRWTLEDCRRRRERKQRTFLYVLFHVSIGVVVRIEIQAPTHPGVPHFWIKQRATSRRMPVQSKAGSGRFCAKPGIFARQTCTQPGARASTGALCVACARSGR